MKNTVGHLEVVGRVREPCPLHHLRGDVLGGAAEGLEPGLVHQLAEPHVRDLHDGERLVRRTQEHVLGLQVPGR